MTSRMTAKAFVGREIRRAREQKGLSRAKLANLLMVSDSLIAAWESGRQGILPEHMKRLLGFNDGEGCRSGPILDFGPDLLVRIVEALVTGEALPEWENKWISAEVCSTSLYSFETTLINGLLQCPEYMQTVLTSEEQLKKRRERQQRFLGGDARPALVAAMDESVLRRNVGGPRTMTQQMEFLEECTKQDNILIHIIPMESTICSTFRTPFLIATLDDGRSVAYTDGAISGEVIGRPDEVAQLRILFDRYRGSALNINESIELIRSMKEKWAT